MSGGAGRAAMLKDDATMAAVEQLQQLADARGIALSQLALAWCMAQPGITSPIIGPRTMEQLEDNLKALDVTLADDDKKQIDAIVPPGGNVDRVLHGQLRAAPEPSLSVAPRRRGDAEEERI